MGNSTSSTKKPPSPFDEYVELAPPPDQGFSGTAKFHAVEQAALIAELIRVGYTRVEPARA